MCQSLLCLVNDNVVEDAVVIRIACHIGYILLVAELWHWPPSTLQLMPSVSNWKDFLQDLTMHYDDDASALYNGQYKPLPSENLATGIFGVLLFSSIVIAVFLLQLSRSKTPLNRLFYASLAMMAILELPRFGYLAKDRSYGSIRGYGAHIVAGIFYFICLAIIGMTFANILELGSLSRMIYGKRGLTLAIMVHTAVDISGLIYCVQSESLESFFSSIYYRFYIIFDIVQNLTYSSILVLFGLRLIFR